MTRRAVFKQTIHIRAHGDASVRGGKSGKTFDQYPFDAALGVLA